jgi:hypothetical protein
MTKNIVRDTDGQKMQPIIGKNGNQATITTKQRVHVLSTTTNTTKKPPTATKDATTMPRRKTFPTLLHMMMQQMKE